MPDLQVLSVASEIYPLVKTGGLADVVGALPGALLPEGVVVRTLVPGYPAVVDALSSPQAVHTFADLHGGRAKLLAAQAAGLDLFVLDAPHLYARPGNPYVGPTGDDWPDNALRFAGLASCAASIARGMVDGYTPHIVHAHDWQAGLAAAFLHYGDDPRPGTVMTVHNLSFQGRFPPHLLGTLGLPPRAFAIDGVEYHGSIGFLKAGLALADRITTVSPTYADEIRTAEAGMGLDGLLRHRTGVVTGILNGIDEHVWNPASDPSIVARYDIGRLDRRAANKAALQQRFGLDADPQAMLFGVISRLTLQKGMDLLLESIPSLTALDAQLAVLGSGDAALEADFTAAARARPGRVGTIIGYDEPLAHLMQGGLDALLVPSRFEPCGLTQLCALRYGTIPVVARVGGLADSIIDANEMAMAAGVATGVQFAPVTRDRLALAIGRTARLWSDRASWRRMQERAMTTDVGWRRSAKHYATLYRELASRDGARET